MTVAKLLEEIFDKAYKNGIFPITREFLLPYIPQLKNINSVDLLEFIIENLDHRESIFFLLCIPEIWESIDIEDWKNIMQSVSPRQKLSLFNPNPNYSDIVFFIKWLNLDGLKFALSLNISLQDKQNICEYCRAKASNLIFSEDYIEDFDDKIVCDIKHLYKYRNKLMNKSKDIEPSYHDEKSFLEYIDRAYANLQRT